MTVAANLGLEQDRRDKHKWKGLGHIISINHGKFYDWLEEKGSGGAIDLVMHVRNCEFKEAVEWLSQPSLSAPMQRQPQQELPKEPRPLELPVQPEKHWSNVRQYLIETRGLPAKLIDHLHTKGLIYADDRYNAVFLRYSDGSDGRNWLRHEPTGASLRGTSNQTHPFYGLAPGSSRENGWFWIGTGKGKVQRVLLTESPIDALSLATLEKKLRPQEVGVTIYLSTDGAGVIPTKALQMVLEQGGTVFAAFDTDAAGEKMAWRVAQELPGIRRMAPASGKDWNDRLLAERQPNPTKLPQPNRGNKQTLHFLWMWHRVAVELGHRRNYLDRITEVAREFVEGQPLSEKAIAAMHQDFRKHSQHIPSNASKQPRQSSHHPTNSQAIQTVPHQSKKYLQGIEMNG